ncbi:MAG: dipeptidase [Oscillospiraceae bacterium]
MYFDAHSDIWTDITTRRLNGETDVFHNRHFERLRKGNVEGSIFVIWVDPPYDTDYDKRTHQIMDCVREEIASCKDFRIVHNYSEMMQARQDGVLYIFIGVEGMAYVGEDLSRIDEYYDFGARHAILTWNEANSLGAGALSGKDYGLTELGRQAVRIIQDKGMVLDVSHLNDAGFWDIAKLATRPFIASHSNSRALCDVPRNLTDDQLRAIRDCNGVVGLNSFNLFVDRDPKKQTVQRLAEHAAHMIDVMGIDHVGCGFDFFEFIENQDTMGSMTEPDASPSTIGLENSSQIPNIFGCFEKMGMTREEMDKIGRLNFQRIIRDTVG